MRNKIRMWILRSLRDVLWAAGDAIHARCGSVPAQFRWTTAGGVADSHDLAEAYAAIIATSPRPRKLRAARRKLAA